MSQFLADLLAVVVIAVVIIAPFMWAVVLPVLGILWMLGK